VRAVGRDDRWQHLVHLAFRLSEALADRGETEGPARFSAPESNRGGAAEVRQSLEASVRALASALEVFGADIDPVDDFEGYAVRRLALALLDVLQLALHRLRG